MSQPPDLLGEVRSDVKEILRRLNEKASAEDVRKLERDQTSMHLELQRIGLSMVKKDDLDAIANRVEKLEHESAGATQVFRYRVRMLATGVAVLGVLLGLIIYVQGLIK